MASMKSPFEVLGIDKSASDKEVKNAYFKLVKTFNPERHGEKFKEIREAYEILRDEEKRLQLTIFEFVDPYTDSEEPHKDLKYNFEFKLTSKLMILDEELVDFGDEFWQRKRAKV